MCKHLNSNKVCPFRCGIPSQPTICFLLVFNEVTCGNMWTFVPQVKNRTFLLIMAQLAMVFDFFGEKLCQDANNSTVSPIPAGAVIKMRFIFTMNCSMSSKSQFSDFGERFRSSRIDVSHDITIAVRK